MRVLAGTSGFSYKEWKGVFYPQKLPQTKFLSYYSEQLPTVELNNTFYRMPREEQVKKWIDQTPERFELVLKASRYITHNRRLVDAEDPVGFLMKNTGGLGSRLGPMLFQLPPYFRKNAETLKSFLDLLPKDRRFAFEFRHKSWFDDEVYEVLRAANAAMVVAEFEEEKKTTPVVSTADWGYLRLRLADYSDEQLQSWSRRINDQGWQRAYVFFKHEEDPTAPGLALRFMTMAGSESVHQGG